MIENRDDGVLLIEDLPVDIDGRSHEASVPPVLFFAQADSRSLIDHKGHEGH